MYGCCSMWFNTERTDCSWKTLYVSDGIFATKVSWNFDSSLTLNSSMISIQHLRQILNMSLFGVVDSTSLLVGCVWLGTDWTLIFYLDKMLAVELFLFCQVWGKVSSKYFISKFNFLSPSQHKWYLMGLIWLCRCDKSIGSSRFIEPYSTGILHKHVIRCC